MMGGKSINLDSLKYGLANKKRWDATCPISVRATITGGVGEMIRATRQKGVNILQHPDFPWQSPPAKCSYRSGDSGILLK
jgi:hypothetical protein